MVPKQSQKHTGGFRPVAVWLDELVGIWDAPPELHRDRVTYSSVTDAWTISNPVRTEICSKDDHMIIDEETGEFHVVTKDLVSRVREQAGVRERPEPIRSTATFTNPRARGPKQNPRFARGNGGRRRSR